MAASPRRQRQGDHPEETEAVEVSVVMPCLNEEQSVGDCVRQARRAMDEAGIRGEVVVVDNMSEDGSAEVAAGAGARVVFQPVRGYGNAYLKGFQEARGKYIVMGDSDGTYDFSLIPQLLQPLYEGYDFVMGSRIKGEIKPGATPWLHRYFGVPAMTFLLNRLSGARLSDAHCGMRAFTREALERMELNTGGMEFASEMILKAARARLKIAEVPVSLLPRKGESKLSTFRDGWRHLRFMLLHSPTELFILPGTAMLVIGLGFVVALVRGPLRFFDIHYMVLGSLLAILGYQVASLGLYARTYAVSEGYVREDRFIARFKGRVNLERGLLVGGLLFSSGLGWLAWILVTWVNRGFGFGGDTLIRPALLGMTLVVLGTQTLFSALFLSVLTVQRRQPFGGQNRRNAQEVTVQGHAAASGNPLLAASPQRDREGGVGAGQPAVPGGASGPGGDPSAGG